MGIHRGYMAGEDHRGLKKIQCWIPVSTWEQIEATGYTSPKLAMTKAIELLLGDFTGSWGDLKGVSGDSCESTEIPELKARIEEKDKQIEEKERHIETLQRDLENSQETHRNYMMQIQTLITQKQIEAPGAKKPWWRFW